MPSRSNKPLPEPMSTQIYVVEQTMLWQNEQHLEQKQHLEYHMAGVNGPVFPLTSNDPDIAGSRTRSGVPGGPGPSTRSVRVIAGPSTRSDPQGQGPLLSKRTPSYGFIIKLQPSSGVWWDLCHKDDLFLKIGRERSLCLWKCTYFCLLISYNIH